ncbi:GFA family protein [Szabonella alba]|uniref:GFA family protein n=1 Tax=Szabonella alba TaxID=2804194 RepID=A0A8K0V920_9RHOB|nr:GFA family protein [Szabonella alba]MBL4916566.1 GFA family protein [Szabonella alba]
MNTVSGHCLCGAVRITVAERPEKLGVCHCSSCRRWNGSASVAFGVSEDALTIEGAENVAAYRSSDWAERCFCRICGSSLWYHLTIPDEVLTHFIAAGLLDDLSGMTIEHELFYDKKPDAITFACDSRKTTEAEFWAAVGSTDEGEVQ